MNTCDTCRWWGNVRGQISEGSKKKCEHISVSEREVPFDEAVSPLHDGNFVSDLFTGPKFGCVHHEGKT